MLAKWRTQDFASMAMWTKKYKEKYQGSPLC